MDRMLDETQNQKFQFKVNELQERNVATSLAFLHGKNYIPPLQVCSENIFSVIGLSLNQQKKV